MKNTIKTLILASASFLLSACGHSPNNKTQEKNTPQTEQIQDNQQKTTQVFTPEVSPNEASKRVHQKLNRKDDKGKTLDSQQFLDMVGNDTISDNLGEKIPELRFGFELASGERRSLDGFRINTGRMLHNGEYVYKWDENIPYEKLKNHHTKEQITAEQVEAAKYFVKEKFNASKDIRNLKENSGEDAQIRNTLFYEENLQNMVAEYKKEMENPEYQAQQRQSRVEKAVAEYNEFQNIDKAVEGWILERTTINGNGMSPETAQQNPHSVNLGHDR